jgi:hypothetical protein
MSALAQCDAFAFIYDQAGDPAPDVLVVLKRVIDASGNPILLGPKTTLTDSAGSFHFTLPELSTAFISARASALWNCPDGRAFTVPPGPSGELVPDFSLPPSTLVQPPLVYVDDVLSIPKASETQDGYLSAADYVAFLAGGAEVGVTQITAGTGLTGGTITDTGTIGIATIPGVAGTWSNPSSITINAQGQIIAISGVADTTAPNISAITAASITSSGATIHWTTDDPSDSQVEYSTDLSYGFSTTINTTPVQSHSVPLTGLIANTPYNYRVKSRNTAGLLTTSGNNTFTTAILADTTPPIITLDSTPVTGITDVAATIHWTTDEASDSQVEYSTDLSYGSASAILDAAPPGTTTHVVPLAGLTASMLYHYRVKSKDAAGNPAIPVTGSFTTTAPFVPPNLLTGLIAMWKLDEPGATDTRATSHGDPGNALFPTLGAGAPGLGSVPSGTGVINLAAHFAGDANHLKCGSNPGLQSGNIDFTWAAWVKFDSIAADSDFISKAGPTGGPDEYIVGQELSAGNRYFRFTVYGGSTYSTVLALAAGAIVAGQWYLVIAWHTSGTAFIQVNDGAVDSAPVAEPIIAGSSDFAVGCYGGLGTANFVFGLVDEVAYWKAILDASSRHALWNGSAGLPFGSWT